MGMQQRSDIQGLRAYAVLAVMLYHFGVSQVAGGFVGVDVFFVISGFLMTSIIVRGLEQRRFTFAGFYLARARRILPALAVLCVAVLGFGWCWLAPSDYTKLGKHAAASIGFVSNFVYMDEEGYFDAPSQSKWLLHTWSLAVEWQFYLLYPLLLAAIARYRALTRRSFAGVLGVFALGSFAASVLLTPSMPAQAFYQLPTRTWELLAGGLVFLQMPQWTERRARAAEWLGMGLILVSAFCFHAEMDWPGSAALLPVAGAVLILAANRQGSWLTANPLAAALGRWSYSIYLWHWPIVVGLGYFAVKTPLWTGAGMVCAILLGALSYWVIEQPARRVFKDARRLTVAACALVVLIAGAGGYIAWQHGVPARVSPMVAAIASATEDRLPEFPQPCGFNRKTLKLTPCVLGDANNIRWAVWGDSHAGSILSAVAEATHSGVLYYRHACSTLFDTELKSKGANNHCTEFTREAWRQIQQLPPQVGVIIVNRYSVNIKGQNEGKKKPWGFIYTDRTADMKPVDPYTLYTDRLVGTLCTVAAERKVYALDPIPEIGHDVPQTMAREAMLGNPAPDVTLPLADYLARNDVARAALRTAHAKCGVHILPTADYFCDATLCHAAQHGMPLYFDDNHLGEAGNKVLVPMFRKLR